MDNEDCRLLVQLYGANDLLWNSKSPQYHNKSLRHDAWVEISKQLDLPIPDLKKKMTILLASYRREKSRMAKSHRPGSAKVYYSKWFAFEDFNNFMKDKDLPNETLDTMQVSENPRRSFEVKVEALEPLDTTECIVEVNTNDPLRINRRNKKRKIHEDQTMTCTPQHIDNITTAGNSRFDEDEFFYFGQSVAAQLRTLPVVNALGMQAKIQKLLTTERRKMYEDQAHLSSPSSSP